jgi:hypothetical protein
MYYVLSRNVVRIEFSYPDEYKLCSTNTNGLILDLYLRELLILPLARWLS